MWCFVAVTAPLAAQQRPLAITAVEPEGFDRSRAQAATLQHVRRLVAIDTRNPPGNELRTARYLDAALQRIPGVETEIIDAGDGRAHFVARLRAVRPTRPPVLIMGHMDVVGVRESAWTTDPLQATEIDGYLYGRGVIDDKGPLAASVVAIEFLAEHRDRLQRDVMLLGTAAEEGGSVGIDWLTDHRPDLFDEVEFALNEGGRVRTTDGRVRTVNVQTTEKVPYNVIARATGPSGHGSVPLAENALAALARAVSRVHAWRAPVHLNETTRTYFARLARVEPDTAMARAMRDLSSSTNERTIRAAADVLSADPLHNAVLRTGMSLTMLDGGIRSNVIPSDGTATLNVRVMPGEDVGAVVREMNAVGAESQVVFELDGGARADPPPSPIDTELFRALEAAAIAMAPDAVVLPFMSTGATDGAVLRSRGIPTYGVLPFPLEMEDELRMHGDNERVPVAALGWGAEFLYRTLEQVAR